MGMAGIGDLAGSHLGLNGVPVSDGSSQTTPSYHRCSSP